MTHDPAEHPAPPPPEPSARPQPAPQVEPVELWPDEPTDELLLDDWVSERDDPDPGWDEPESDEAADEPSWDQAEQPVGGVELADEPEAEDPTQDVPWDTEAPLQRERS